MPGQATSRYPARPPWMRALPSTARSLLTRVATFCSGAAGRSPGHRTSTIRSSGDQARPFDREQLEQRPRLPAADLPVGQFGSVADDPEGARETQFNACSAD